MILGKFFLFFFLNLFINNHLFKLYRLTPDQYNDVVRLCQANENSQWVVTKFQYSKYPAFFNIADNRGSYAWKPAIILEVMKQYGDGILLWLDSGNLFHQPPKTLLSYVKNEGIFSSPSKGIISELTHPKTLSYLSVEETKIELNRRNRNAAMIGFNLHVDWVRSFIEKWSSLASIRECIAPDGSSLKNHRYDQSLLTILYYQHQRKHQFNDDYPPEISSGSNQEYSIHNDVDVVPVSSKTKKKEPVQNKNKKI